MKIAAVFAHPDDEALAAGSTLAAYALADHDVVSLTFTDGVSSRPMLEEQRLTSMKVRYEEYRAACRILHAYPLGSNILPYPDQRLEEVPLMDLANRVKNLVGDADVIFTHWPHDLNQDHQRIAEAVLIATRPSSKTSTRSVYACEIPESTGQHFGAPVFSPNVFFAANDQTIEAKLAAVAAYRSEDRGYPHPRNVQSIRERASYWGGLSGFKFAEAFVLLRVLKDFWP